jgi:CheY-like chemotaxis protein
MTRILVVDDDRGSSTVLLKIMTSRGFAVDVANDGVSAIGLIEKNHYDLAILDYEMPGMNGVELFREARKHQADLTGIFVTAHANLNTVFPAIDVGIERVLAKPVDSEEVIRVADELIECRWSHLLS